MKMMQKLKIGDVVFYQKDFYKLVGWTLDNTAIVRKVKVGYESYYRHNLNFSRFVFKASTKYLEVWSHQLDAAEIKTREFLLEYIEKNP